MGAVIVGEYNGQPYTLTGDEEHDRGVLYDLYVVHEQSVVRIARMFGIARHVMTKRFRQLSIPIRSPGDAGRLAVQKFAHNKDAFIPFNHDGCYIMGLMMTDGHIAEDRRIQIIMADDSRALLEDISRYLLGENNVKHQKVTHPGWQDRAVLVVNNAKHIADLKGIGFPTVDRTGNEVFLDFGNDTLTWAFVRGVFDGDGHVGVYRRDGRRWVGKVSFTIAGLQFLNDLKCFLAGQGIKIPAKAIQDKKGCYCLEFSSLPEIKKFRDKLYAYGTLRLKRKYDRFKILDDIV